MDSELRRRRRGGDPGDPEERAYELRQRLRAGELAQDRVRLAAHAGDEGARAAWPELELLEGHENFNGWVAALWSCGREAVVRLALAYEREQGLEDDPRVLAWLADPSAEHGDRLRARVERGVWIPPNEHGSRSGSSLRVALALDPSEVAVVRIERTGFDEVPTTLELRCDATHVFAHHYAGLLARRPLDDPLRARLRAEWVPWLLQ
ncbi:MAG TPA: hypothetical protein DEA08_01790 [Planctomycetes bacterium]|nr:hypothetical protein [Planctomycetota bacterium]